MPKPTHVAIAADSPETVSAGKMLADMGGNVVDIAVGSAIAAAQTELLMCSLGGSAFLNIKMPGQPAIVIDGADAMPISASGINAEQASWRTTTIPYGDGITINVGHGSVAVPGMLGALELAWQRYGSLSWTEIMQPALHYARHGSHVTQTLAQWLDLAGEAVFSVQDASRACFFPHGRMLSVGQKFRIPDYVCALEMIRDEGARAFYQGDIGVLFERELQANGGHVTRQDLAEYQAIVRNPLQIQSRGYTLALNPPPSIGGAMLGSMIRLYEAQLTEQTGTAEKILLQAKAQRTMFDLRHQESAGDWNDDRASLILEPEWLLKYQHKVLSPHTMHMSFATDDGAVMSITMSNGYGSGITIPGTGITCNNSLGEPELNPHGFFQIPPEGKFVSNMSPVTAWHDSGEALALGSPGASRIATALLQGWIHFALDGQTAKASTQEPRFHVEQVDGEFVLQHEPGIEVSLARKLFKTRPFEQKHMYFGALNIAGISDQGELYVSADDRRHGAELITG